MTSKEINIGGPKLQSSRNEKVVIINQTNARAAARRLGLSPRGTIYVIRAATKRGQQQETMPDK